MFDNDNESGSIFSSSPFAGHSTLPESSPVGDESMSNGELPQQMNPNLQMMDKIAKNEQTLDEIRMLTSSKVTDQLKVFLVSQARNELSRVIKLTQFLDKLETHFMSKVDNTMLTDDLTLKQYGEVIGVITSLLSRSNEIVTRVLKDDSLMTILNTTIYTADSTSSQSTSVVANLKDSQSRERVRVVIQQILNRSNEYINSPEINNDDNIITVTDEEMTPVEESESEVSNE